MPVSAELADAASQGLSAILAAYFPDVKSEFERAISRRTYETFDGTALP
jgi:hypothetical protein